MVGLMAKDVQQPVNSQHEHWRMEADLDGDSHQPMQQQVLQVHEGELAEFFDSEHFSSLPKGPCDISHKESC
jgi:hypothetical protein